MTTTTCFHCNRETRNVESRECDFAACLAERNWDIKRLRRLRRLAAEKPMNDIDDNRVFIPDTVLSAVHAHKGRTSNGIVRRMIRKATPIDVADAADLMGTDLDPRDIYLLDGGRKAVMRLRHNHQEDGHTFVEYLRFA